jgi:hypothetical protein
MGSWVSYGLGSMNENLPTFIVLPDGHGFAPTGRRTGAPVLPASHQGTMIVPAAPTRSDLFPPRLRLTLRGERGGDVEAAARMNRDHMAQREEIRGWTRASPLTDGTKLQLGARC